jgi:hypothetical protein
MFRSLDESRFIAIRKCLETSDYDIRSSLQHGRNEAFKSTFRQSVIRIEEQKICTRCGLDTCVSGRGKAAVLVMTDYADARILGSVLLNDSHRTILAAVIHTDGLKIGKALGQNAIEAFLDILFNVVNRDDDGNARHGNSMGTFFFSL